MGIYQVKDWDANFENNRSRQIDQCNFVCIPNKQHGMGFIYIMSQADGMIVYGCWCALLGVLSRQDRPRDGWLTDTGRPDGRPWTTLDLSLQWRRPESEVERMLQVVTSERVGWITSHERHSIVIPSSLKEGMEGRNGSEGMEGKEDSPVRSGTNSLGPMVDDLTKVEFPLFPISAKNQTPNTWRLSDALISELAATYPAVDVPAECRRAWQWIKTNLGRRKTAKGMPKFLNTWMAKQQDRGGSQARSTFQPASRVDEQRRRLEAVTGAGKDKQ